MDADVHHGLGLFQLLAVAHHLGWRPAFGDHLLSETSEWWLGIDWAVSGAVSFCHPLRNVALSPFQTQYSEAGLARSLDVADAIRRSVLDHRTEFLQDFVGDPGLCSCAP